MAISDFPLTIPFSVVVSEVPVIATLSAAGPFTSPDGVPQEGGVNLPAWYSQGFQAILGFSNDGAGSFTVTVKDSGGTVVGVLAASFSYTLFSNTLIYTTTATPGAVLASYDASYATAPSGVYSADNDNGALAIYSTGNFSLNTPIYSLNVPYGGSVTGTYDHDSNPTGNSCAVYFVSRPAPISTLSTTGALTASKNNSSSGRWISGSSTSPLYSAASWDAYYLSGGWNKVSATPGPDPVSFGTLELEAGLSYVYVRVINADGLIGWVLASATIPEEELNGSLPLPSGALLIPAKRVAGGTSILRYNEGLAPQNVADLPTETGVWLMRQGAALYKGNTARALSISTDDGVTWTVLSSAFDSTYKTISWCGTAPDGGFAALASKNKLLYVSHSLSGTTWSAPIQIFGDGTRSVARAQIRQMNESGESHLLVSDGTFAVRSDDYFSTAGTTLFS